MFENLLKPMRFITNRDVNNKDIPVGWCRVCLGEIPDGWRELTEEELIAFFKDE